MPVERGTSDTGSLLQADAVVERRRLRRSVTGWRVAAIVAIALAVIAGVGLAGGLDDVRGEKDQIARLSVSGVITDDRDRIELIERMAKDPAVKGVIVAINSPGGTTAGGEGLYDALRRLAEKKPVVATIGTLGASAGYMTAIAADHIVARRTSITGSIGVLFQYGDAAKLLDTIGVEIGAVKSAPLKAEPAPYAPATPEAKAMLKSVVDDTYAWFVDIVAERRRLPHDRALALADGRIMTGHQAREAELVDAIGGEEVAIAWLEKDRKVAAGLPVEDWEVKRRSGLLSLASSVGESLASGVTDGLFRSFGIAVDSAAFSSAGQRVDGLQSLWHVGPTGYDDDGGQGASQQ